MAASRAEPRSPWTGDAHRRYREPWRENARHLARAGRVALQTMAVPYVTWRVPVLDKGRVPRDGFCARACLDSATAAVPLGRRIMAAAESRKARIHLVPRAPRPPESGLDQMPGRLYFAPIVRIRRAAQSILRLTPRQEADDLREGNEEKKSSQEKALPGEGEEAVAPCDARAPSCTPSVCVLSLAWFALSGARWQAASRGAHERGEVK